MSSWRSPVESLVLVSNIAIFVRYWKKLEAIFSALSRPAHCSKEMRNHLSKPQARRTSAHGCFSASGPWLPPGLGPAGTAVRPYHGRYAQAQQWQLAYSAASTCKLMVIRLQSLASQAVLDSMQVEGMFWLVPHQDLTESHPANLLSGVPKVLPSNFLSASWS